MEVLLTNAVYMQKKMRIIMKSLKSYLKGACFMSREYAVVNLSENPPAVLYQTAGFRCSEAAEKIDMADGVQLWIAGEDTSQELMRQIRELESENKAKETFLSSMSHDMRTPMNAIIGLTALAKKHIDEKARVADSLSKIETASAHLLSLINEVLDMSRISSGRMSVSEERFSLSDILHDTLIIVRPMMTQKGHEFIFRTENIEYESLRGDALRLRQIFVNIISNAAKYTDAGGKVEVAVSEETAGEKCLLCFRCTDNGIGMSPEFLKTVFDPFTRAENSGTSKTEGTGLGMSIVRQLTEMMHGTVSIESEPGMGTSVDIRIPLAYEIQELDTAVLKNKNLLVIEADKESADRFRAYLGESGAEFKIVSSSADAVSELADAEFHNHMFDGVIIGGNTGSGSVFEIASYIHKAEPAIRIVLVSSDNWEEIEYRAERSGIVRFIPAPFFRKSLINGLNEVFVTQEKENNLSMSADLGGMHILLVEDNMINRMIAEEILSSAGAEVETAENGKEACDLFEASEAGKFDVILMDIQMPVMDGYEAVRNIRKMNRADAETVRIYAMTANTFAEDIARAREAGMDGHIAKPVDINRLLTTLRHAV